MYLKFWTVTIHRRLTSRITCTTTSCLSLRITTIFKRKIAIFGALSFCSFTLLFYRKNMKNMNSLSSIFKLYLELWFNPIAPRKAKIVYTILAFLGAIGLTNELCVLLDQGVLGESLILHQTETGSPGHSEIDLLGLQTQDWSQVLPCQYQNASIWIHYSPFSHFIWSP